MDNNELQIAALLRRRCHVALIACLVVYISTLYHHVFLTPRTPIPYHTLSQNSKKRSRPPSATAIVQAAQQESSAALVSMAGIFPQLIQSLNAPLLPAQPAAASVVSDCPPPTDLGRAINLLTQSASSESGELNMDEGDLMDLMDYFSSNPSAATVFANTGSVELRVRWARRRLSIIRGGNSS